MSYLTELHCHTSNVSQCAHDTPEHLLQTYAAHNYSTLVITNHFRSGTFEVCGEVYERCQGGFYSKGYDHSIIHRANENKLSWADKVKHFCEGAAYLKEIAPKEMHILMGAEFDLPSYWGEYLAYGIDENFLFDHPNLDQYSIEELSRTIHSAGALLVLAHPFRGGDNRADACFVDGAEIYNGGLDVHRNTLALTWTKEHRLIQASGSDYHNPENRPTGGIVTDDPIETMEQLVFTLKNNSFKPIIPEAYYGI